MYDVTWYAMVEGQSGRPQLPQLLFECFNFPRGPGLINIIISLSYTTHCVLHLNHALPSQIALLELTPSIPEAHSFEFTSAHLQTSVWPLVKAKRCLSQ